MRLPPVGTFLLPIGATGPRMYCLQVLKVIPADGSDLCDYLECKRWGVDDDNQPLDDGHLLMNYHRGLVRQIGNGLAYRFNEGDPWGLEPLYYRRIVTRGQQDLFV